MVKIGFDIFSWDSRRKLDRNTQPLNVEFEKEKLEVISKFIYANKSDFLDDEPNYFINFPEDPEPLAEDELIHNPAKLLDYINSPAWSSSVVSILSRLLNWGEASQSDCLVVGINGITNKNEKLYILNIDVNKIDNKKQR